MTKQNFFRLLVSVLICELAGIIGSFFTTPAIPAWYASLTKPSFNPPNWLFGPVWTTLFLLMGIAFYLIWQKLAVNKTAKLAMIIFIIHLGFNTLWSILFFGLRNPFYGLIDIAILWLMIVYLIYAFMAIDKRAAYLLVPYLLWVSFATVLNFAIWQLN